MLRLIKEMNTEIGKNPAALDDLIKETASKLAFCPLVLAPPARRRTDFL